MGYILPEDQQAELIRYAQQIAQTEKVKYALNDLNSPPYIRLYEVVLPTKNVPEAYQRLELHTQQMYPIKFGWSSFEEEIRHVMLWGRVNEYLRITQMQLIHLLADLRQGYYKQKYYGDNTLEEKSQQASLQKWGWPWVDQYHPYVIVAQSLTDMNLSHINFEWEYKTCYSETFFFGTKVKPGTFIEPRRLHLHL